MPPASFLEPLKTYYFYHYETFFFLFLSGFNEENQLSKINRPNGEEKASSVRSCQIGEDQSSGAEDQGGDLKADLMNWEHLMPPLGQLGDECLDEACQYITYAFKNVRANNNDEK